MPLLPFPGKIKAEKARRGFAAVTSVVLISGIAIISSIAVAAEFIIESRETTNRAFAVQARTSAYSCANIAMLRLRLNSGYTGNENISVDNVNCSIESVASSDAARTVYANATVNGYSSRIKVEIADIDEFFLNSWTEVPPT